MSVDYGSVNGYGIDISNISYKSVLNLLDKLNPDINDEEEIRTALLNDDEEYIDLYVSGTCGCLCGIYGIIDDILTGHDRYGIFFASKDEEDTSHQKAYIMYDSPIFKTEKSQFFTKEEIDERLLELTDILGLKNVKPYWCSTHWYG